MGYLTNFIVYTLAMVGVFVVALLVFKHSAGLPANKNSKNMKVLDTLTLSPRKTLYVISVGNEKFLIAGDTERTNLISKLDCGYENLSLQCNTATQQRSFIPHISDIKNNNEKKINSLMKNLSKL